jgi:hypothetical protein
MANVPEEAMYWTTTKDSMGQKLNGQHDYVLHFLAGQLPPNDAFWSLTMTDVQSYMVARPICLFVVKVLDKISIMEGVGDKKPLRWRLGLLDRAIGTRP